MSVKTISVEDLIAECHIDSPAEFRRLLRRRGLSMPPRDKPIKRDIANDIALALTGKAIDWFKYEQIEKARNYEGPLGRKPFAALDDPEQVEGWYQKLQTKLQDKARRGNQLLGIVFTGGFLGGKDGSEFVLNLEPGVNVFIGHRGAGKSTMLNLLGLIADSVSDETNVLIDKILSLLETNSDEMEITRRVKRTLKKYGVNKYACFFIKDSNPTCYLININESAYDILTRDEGPGTWQSLPKSREDARPRMQVLQQGEVMRISEERENSYLNNLLDTLYPDLYQNRRALARLIKRVEKQSSAYKKNQVPLNTSRVERFIERRSSELRRVAQDIRQGNLSPESVQLITSYLNRIHQVNRHALPPTIHELLKGEEDEFYHLYLGRIVPFLAGFIGRLEQLQERRSAIVGEAYTRLEEQTAFEDTIINSEMMVEIDEDKKVLAELDLAGLGEGGEGGNGSAAASLEAALFLETLEVESNNPVYREMLVVGRRILDLLYTRLRILRTWARIFAKPRLEWDSSLAALVDTCVQLLQERLALLSLQEKKCKQVAEIVSDEQLEVRIFSRAVVNSADSHRVDSAGLNRLAVLYERLFSATPSSRLGHLRNAADECDGYLDRLMEVRKIVRQVVESGEQHEFLFIPVEVELRQGGIYRHFNQLSFGQKSGIILKMVLLTGNKGVLIIDQPEDNLDANSINMLSPTLNRLGENRQIIIATHNSNLVLTLEIKNLIVMESTGETGRIKESGSPLSSKRLVAEMLDILEGGVDTFALKMSTYEQFTTRVRGEIQDMDLQLIESSFRRRTIDNLRNLLQPVVSSKSMIDFARHELGQRDQAGLQRGVAEMRKLIAESATDKPPELLSKLDAIFGRLESYVERLNIAINDIRMMDTKAQPRDLEIYALLSELKKDYLERIDKKRLVLIDLDEQLKGRLVHADEDHLRLVFRNLMNNSFRATERKVLSGLRSGQSQKEAVKIKLMDESNNRLALLFMDNGCGVPPQLKGSLYIERCTDRRGGEHGLGGVIIRKLLNLNGGTIQLLDGHELESDFVTLQRITLPGVGAATRGDVEDV